MFRITSFGYSAFALVSAVLVFYAYVRAGSPEWLALQLRRPALMAFGKYSYGIYVLHDPIATYQNALVMRIAEHVPRSTHVLLWGISKLFGVGVSFAVALVSWHLLEKHFLGLKKYFAPQAR